MTSSQLAMQSLHSQDTQYKGSEEYQSPIQTDKYLSTEKDIADFKELLNVNFNGANSKNLCATCWCLCNRYQLTKHRHLNHQLLTPRHFKDWRSFVNLAE